MPPPVRVGTRVRTAGRWPVYGTVYGLGVQRDQRVVYVRWDGQGLDTRLPETLVILGGGRG